MRRNKPMKRSRVKKSNPARKASEFQRAYGGASRVEFVKSLPCCVESARCAGGIENAHTRGGGASRKADASTVCALCAFHHASLHILGRVSFERLYLVDLDHEARRTEELWQGRGRTSELTPIADILRARPWQCTAKRSHGPCNTVNDAEDESCGACGNDAPARARSDEGAA